MNARAETCLRLIRKALALAAEHEREPDTKWADIEGDVATRALEAAVFIDQECAI